MISRRFTCMLAIFAMLANASLVVLHAPIAIAAAMARANAQPLAGGIDPGLWIVCGSLSHQTADKQSDPPGKPDNQRLAFDGCPICAGLLTACVLADIQDHAFWPLTASEPVRGLASRDVRPPAIGPWPPNRGPPTLFAQS